MLFDNKVFIFDDQLSTMTPIRKNHLYESVKLVIDSAYRNVFRAANTGMVTAYWEIGRLIVEEEQNGASRADYGKMVLKELSEKLTDEFGKGYTEANLRNFRQFYLAFPKICEQTSGDNLELQKRYTLCSELSWSHYRLLMRVENLIAREFYIKETVAQNWSVRALGRQISTLYYERIISSRDKAVVKKEAEEKTEALAESPRDFIKDPYILEFLKLNPTICKISDKKLNHISWIKN